MDLATKTACIKDPREICHVKKKYDNLTGKNLGSLNPVRD